MPELLIRYKNKKTLEILLDFARHFNFSIVLPKTGKKKDQQVNGVTILSGDSSVNTSELETIFSRKDLDANQLRKSAWRRT